MIVELFGAPGAGKTTFAHRIGESLQARRHPVRILISARPSETAAVPDAEYIGGRTGPATTVPSREAADTALEAVNREFMRRLPPHSLLWRLRLRRYLRVLASSWTRNASSTDIVIFDQGYTQALCSLISLTRSPEVNQIAAAVAMLPEPSIRICVEVPRGMLIARQQQRMRDMTFPERILELDPATNLAQADICANLRNILRDRLSLTGRVPLLCPDPMQADLEPLLDTIACSTAPARRGAPGRRILGEVDHR